MAKIQFYFRFVEIFYLKNLRVLTKRFPKKSNKEVYMKQTYQPKKKQRSKVHGFRARMKTLSGRKVLKNRRNKGKKELTR